MVYQNVLSAVVSALAAECKDSTSRQAWQKLIDLDVSKAGRPGAPDRDLIDCWVFARLHSELIPRHWHALAARYGTHKGRKVKAISSLAPLIASPAPQLFVYKAVTAWAIPPIKGLQASSGREVASRSDRERAERDSLHAGVVKRLAGGEMPGDAGQARREQYVKRSTDMIVLPPSFYDMNTWDLEANPERTRRRWRQGVSAVLDEMVKEALQHAETILQAEGVLFSHPA